VMRTRRGGLQTAEPKTTAVCKLINIKGAGEGGFPSGKSVLSQKTTTLTERKPINEEGSICRNRFA
jgi:hypothetical protein